MKITSDESIVWVVRHGESFDNNAWFESMRCFSINWQKKKSTEDAPIWHPVEGRGYVIWISRPHLWWHDNLPGWRVIISASASMPESGRTTMSELVQAMVNGPLALELFEPSINKNEEG